MIKSELVLKLVERNPHLYQRDVENILNTILGTITEALAKEEDLISVIPNFHQIIDYICFDVMKHKKFIKYMTVQEEKMQKAENKLKKKKDV